MPTLGEALDACAGVWVNIEIKNDERDPDFDPDDRVAVEVLAALAEREPGRWLLSCFRAADRRSLPAARSERADGVADARDRPRHGRRSSRRAGTPPCTRGSRPITAEQIEHCHEAGILVNVWTCNDPDRFVALAAAGADGIVTDVPDVMIAALGTAPAVTPVVLTVRRPQSSTSRRRRRVSAAWTRRTASGTWVNSRRSVSPR